MSRCLQSQDMVAMYEAYDGVRPCKGGKKCVPVKSHPLRPICSRMHKTITGTATWIVGRG